jgi:hypothetical protein
MGEYYWDFKEGGEQYYGDSEYVLSRSSLNTGQVHYISTGDMTTALYGWYDGPQVSKITHTVLKLQIY